MIPGNIKINNVKSLDAKLVNDKYYDFMLFKGEVLGASLSGDCLAGYIDFNNPDCYTLDGGVKSLYSWKDSRNEGVSLNHIGMVGMDNGLITFDKNTIRNKVFYDLFFNSRLNIASGDTNFHMHAVDGNTKKYSYGIEIGTEDGKHYLSCKGGFMQGFFKLEGHDYQVLPSYIESDWHFEINLRPRSDYEVKDNILNNTYPENAGTFFYIGARAENKFAELMNKTDAYTDNYSPSFLDYAGRPNDYYKYDDPDYPYGGDIDFFRTMEREVYEMYLSDEKDISLSGVTLSAKTGYMEIETDNKFVFFNRTCTGFTVHNWDGDAVLLTGYTRQDYKTNAFLLFNRTCTGLTAHDVDRYFESVWDETDDYNIMKDMVGNAFSLKYNSDGSISYNYTMRDCDAEEGWSLQSETTLPGLIKDGEWNSVNVRFSILNNSFRPCTKMDENGNMVTTYVPQNIGSRKMKISIYINGRLVFISKELNEFRFRGFNDMSDRQEGVPYNISIGGGTQGLGERIWLDYLEPVKKHYHLEKTYAGSFIGDISSFKMYDCAMNLQTIKNNYQIETFK